MPTTKTYSSELERCHDRMPPQLDSWIRALGLEDELAYVIYTVTTWTKHCAFPDTTDENRAIACMDLALWLFQLDDATDDYERFFAQCADILDNRLDPELETPILTAFREVFERVAARGMPMDDFIADRRKLIECYRRRNRAKKGENIRYDEYFEIRKTTVYVRHWVGIWSILDNFFISEEMRDLPAIRSLLDDLMTWHIIENELESLERDSHTNTPNLVYLYESEFAASRDQSIAVMRSLQTAALERFEEIYNSFIREDSPANLRRYVTFLRRALLGGAGNYQDDQVRYTHL